MNVETASLTTSSARVSLAGHHAGGCGGCARDKGKGEKESLSVYASAWLSMLGGSFISFLITYAIGKLRDAGSAQGPEISNVMRQHIHSSCHPICHPVTDCAASQAGRDGGVKRGRRQQKRFFLLLSFL